MALFASSSPAFTWETMSKNSSNVPRPPGKVTNASASEVMRVLRVARSDSQISSVHGYTGRPFLFRPSVTTPMTLPPASPTPCATAPISPTS